MIHRPAALSFTDPSFIVCVLVSKALKTSSERVRVYRNELHSLNEHDTAAKVTHQEPVHDLGEPVRF
jgi:hypothetical protein